VIAGACNEGAFVVLSIYKVNGKIGRSVEEVENVVEYLFFSDRIERGGGDLFFVEVAKGTIGSASGAAELVDCGVIFGIFGDNELSEERVDVRAKVNIAGKVGFGSVRFFIRVERAGGRGILVYDVSRVVFVRDEFQTRLREAVLGDRSGGGPGSSEFEGLFA
jgi:hypothetical protein